MTNARRIATMNTAVATKIPARSPLATAVGMIGERNGWNNAGLALAKKNSTRGPRSSASLRSGLSCGFSAIAMPLRIDPRYRAGKISCRKRREVIDAFADADEMNGQREFLRQGHENSAARGAIEFGH